MFRGFLFQVNRSDSEEKSETSLQFAFGGAIAAAVFLGSVAAAVVRSGGPTTNRAVVGSGLAVFAGAIGIATLIVKAGRANTQTITKETAAIAAAVLLSLAA
jgi:hypothetical protein